MAFNNSALAAYVEHNSKKFATKAVAGSKTADLLISNSAFQAGVKGTSEILRMDADVNLQDANTCGRSALGGVTLTNKMLTVKPIKDEQDFCVKDLYGKYTSEMIAKGQNPEDESMDAEFVNSIMDYRAQKIANAIERLLWRGDTTAGAGNNLRFFDGIVKQVSTSSDKIVLTETGSDILAKLQSVYNQMPVEITEADDFRIFIGQDLWKTYVTVLGNRNLYNPSDNNTVYATSAKIEVVPGLNGSNVIIAAKISDFQLGMDGTNDADKAELRYSMETKKYYMDFHVAVGITAIFTAQIGYLALA